VSIGDPIPTKLETFPFRSVREGVEVMMFSTISNTNCWVMTLVKMTVLETLRSRPVFFEDVLEIRQNLKCHTQLGFDVFIVRINKHPGPWVLLKSTSPCSGIKRPE
jgi:hypothetical protein